MYEVKKIGKLLKSKSVGTGPSSYEKKNLPGRGLTKVEKHCFIRIWYIRSVYSVFEFPDFTSFFVRCLYILMVASPHLSQIPSN